VLVAPVAVVANVLVLCVRSRLPKLAIAAARGTLEDRSDMGAKDSPQLVVISRAASACCSGNRPCDFMRLRYHLRNTRATSSTTAIPATPPITPPTTCCCAGVNAVPEEPPELEDELAEAAEPVEELVAAAPPCGPNALEAAEPVGKKLVCAGPDDPKTAVLEERPCDEVLVTRVLSWPTEVAEIESGVAVAITKVPFVNEYSIVDVAVTVTVDSELVMVLLLPAADEDSALRAVARGSFEVEDAKEVSVGRGVVGGVDVMTDCEESSASVVTAVVSVGCATSTASTVSVPKDDTDTRTSLVAAATTVASSVVEPTSTLISTTLAVTVASGTRGRRCTAAFRRTNCGLCRGTLRWAPCCISDKAMVRVGVCNSITSALSLRELRSELKIPSLITKPASRGNLESGRDILSLFAG
jgi:hypothetical protein